MTSAEHRDDNAGRDPETGRRIVQVSSVEIARVQARIAIGKKLGIPPTEYEKAVAALGDRSQ